MQIAFTLFFFGKDIKLCLTKVQDYRFFPVYKIHIVAPFCLTLQPHLFVYYTLKRLLWPVAPHYHPVIPPMHAICLFGKYGT